MTAKEEVVAFLNVRIEGHRDSLTERCKALAIHLDQLVGRLESDIPHGCICLNTLGEVQAQGGMIDAECGRFMATVETIQVIEQIKEIEPPMGG